MASSKLRRLDDKEFRERVVTLLKELEMIEDGGLAFCPTCGGESGMPWTPTHKPDCKLAALLREAERDSPVFLQTVGRGC